MQGHFKINAKKSQQPNFDILIVKMHFGIPIVCMKVHIKILRGELKPNFVILLVFKIYFCYSI